MIHSLFRLVLVIGLFSVVGCASTNPYQLKSLVRTEALKPGSTILVTIPSNGRTGSTEFTASGRQTARAIAAAFARHVKRVDVPGDIGNLSNPASVSAGRYDYKVIPQILHWEDRNTQWSSQPDRINIQLRVIRVSDDTTVSLGAVSGKSDWHAVGAADPEDLLPTGIEAYVDWLFTDPATPLPVVKTK
jgi:hypothetical protein